MIAFVACYWHGIVSYGFVAGVCLGWIPSSGLAWLIFTGIVTAASALARRRERPYS
jgi:hypothetical protein